MGKLKRRVEIVQSSIFDLLFTSNDPEKISFILVLNRILVLVQKPITFVLYKREGDSYKRYHSFVFDKTYKEKFLGIVGELETNEIFKDPNNLFPLFNSEAYKIAVFFIKRKTENKVNDFDFITYQRDEYQDENKKYIQSIIKKLLTKSHGEKFVKIIDASIANILPNQTNYDNNYGSIKNYFGSIKIDQKEYENKIKEGCRKSINESIQKAFNKIHLSTKIINSYFFDYKSENNANNETILSNILFFVRDYANVRCDNEEIFFYTRSKDDCFSGYNYSIRISLPEKQKKEITSYFSELNQNDTISFCSEKNNDNLSRTLDSWFWHSLKEDKEKFLSSIVDILTTELGESARSITDACFNNGLVQYRKPFFRGGLDRAGISDDERKIDCLDDPQLKSKIIDCKRIVICHYLFAGMAKMNSDNSNIDDMEIVMIPVELNGRVFAVTLHVVINKKNEDKTYNTDKIWNEIYHLYSGIGARIERNLRKYLKAFLVEEISCFFFENMEKILDDSFKNHDKTINYRMIIEYTNSYSFLLSSFVPYGFIEFDNHNNNEIYIKIINEEASLNYSQISENLFFPRYRNNILGAIEPSDFKHNLIEGSDRLDSYLDRLLDNTIVAIRDYHANK